MYFRKLLGEKVYLSPTDVNDAEKFVKWINDLEITQYTGLSRKIIGITKEKKILEYMIKDSHVNFSIIDKEMDRLIGVCGLFDIDNINDTAKVGIFIGDSGYIGQGYGTDAVRLVLDYGFNILNLENISLGVYGYNKRAIKSYKKCGFKEIGMRREAQFIGGEYQDVLFMDILATEFESPYIKGVVDDAMNNRTSASKLEIV